MSGDKPYARTFAFDAADISLLSPEEMTAILAEQMAAETGDPASAFAVWHLHQSQTRKLNEAMTAFSHVVFDLLDSETPTPSPSVYLTRLIGVHLANAVAVAAACKVSPDDPAYRYAEEIGRVLGNTIARLRANAQPRNPE